MSQAAPRTAADSMEALAPRSWSLWASPSKGGGSGSSLQRESSPPASPGLIRPSPPSPSPSTPPGGQDWNPFGGGGLLSPPTTPSASTSDKDAQHHLTQCNTRPDVRDWAPSLNAEPQPRIVNRPFCVEDHRTYFGRLSVQCPSDLEVVLWDSIAESFPDVLVAEECAPCIPPASREAVSVSGFLDVSVPFTPNLQGLCIALRNGFELQILQSPSPSSASSSSSPTFSSQARLPLQFRLVRRRVTVVLDLDHTLVHATSDFDEKASKCAVASKSEDVHLLELHHGTKREDSNALPVDLDCCESLPPLWGNSTSAASTTGAVGCSNAVSQASSSNANLHDCSASARETILVKVRPGARELISWLSGMSNAIEVVVCSAGVRTYVEAVVDIFDPKRALIKHVFSRENLRPVDIFDPMQWSWSVCPGAMPSMGVPSGCSYPPSSTACLKDMNVLGIRWNPRSTVILDDRPDVWIQCQNVLRVEAFVHFESDKDVVDAAQAACLYSGRTGSGFVGSLAEAQKLLMQFVSAWRAADRPDCFSWVSFVERLPDIVSPLFNMFSSFFSNSASAVAGGGGGGGGSSNGGIPPVPLRPVLDTPFAKGEWLSFCPSGGGTSNLFCSPPSVEGRASTDTWNGL